MHAVSPSYRPEYPPALKEVWMQVEPRQRIPVCGCTGRYVYSAPEFLCKLTQHFIP